jgi:hypothetical protein
MHYGTYKRETDRAAAPFAAVHAGPLGPKTAKRSTSLHNGGTEIGLSLVSSVEPMFLRLRGRPDTSPLMFWTCLERKINVQSRI